MATNARRPGGIDLNQTMTCSICGNSCRVRCMITHINEFTCHNKDCPLHTGSVFLDPFKGKISPWNSDPNFRRIGPYYTRPPRDQGRDRGRFDDDFLRGSRDRGRDRDRRAPPFRDDTFKRDPFDDDFFKHRHGRMGTSFFGDDPFADEFFQRRPGGARPTWDRYPFGMDSFMADFDRLTERFERGFGIWDDPFGASYSPFGRTTAPGCDRSAHRPYPGRPTRTSRPAPSHPQDRTRNRDQSGGQRTRRTGEEPFRYQYVGTEEPDDEDIYGYNGHTERRRR
ncbi:hypothetical protein C8A03DRAFT_32445 [Achaetomium macrosporum]|uniref:Uncharacterized protein n=1 Tax=Achaetomium macrosporum TaxID=79813 RepID=A0AAN7HGG3_9PEZI|nr:hypothetical protein C8A03DRAFT_32445 [Achaetomium macrosporum]